jgi:hypothetical protein
MHQPLALAQRDGIRALLSLRFAFHDQLEVPDRIATTRTGAAAVTSAANAVVIYSGYNTAGVRNEYAINYQPWKRFGMGRQPSSIRLAGPFASSYRSSTVGRRRSAVGAKLATIRS